MPRFYYSPRAEKEMSAYLRYNSLKFTLKYLNSGSNPNKTAIIDNIFCMMSEKVVKNIIASATKTAGAIRPLNEKNAGEEDFFSTISKRAAKFRE